MRLLFLSNFYPPADRGGYEQWCQEVADAFRSRGHRVVVLTSRYGIDKIREPESDVRRVLYLESDLHHYRPLDFFLGLPERDRHNRLALENAIKECQPEAILVWGMWQLNPQLAVLAEDLCPGRVAYYFCGFWPIPEEELDPHTRFWRQPESHRWKQLIKQPIAHVALARLQQQRHRQPELCHVACVSQYVLETYHRYGRALSNGRVIYGGIDLEQFYRPPEAIAARSQQDTLRLLFAGSVTHDKGVDTAIAALARLAQAHAPGVVHLTVVGTGHPAFEAALRQFVHENCIESYVDFRGWVHKDAMARLIGEFDVLLFPSFWQEPLARMMMEGMAAGLVLVSTTTGGSKEFLDHGRNSLTFRAGDADDLVRQIERLLGEPGLGRRLALAGQQTAVEKFDFNRMVDEMESFVGEMIRQNTP